MIIILLSLLPYYQFMVPCEEEWQLMKRQYCVDKAGRMVDCMILVQVIMQIGVNNRNEISLAIMNNCTWILFLSILHILFYSLCRLFVVYFFTKRTDRHYRLLF